MIKDNFVLGFSLKEVLLMAVCGAVCFYFLQLYDKGFAYQWTITLVIFMGALLLEVPTMQQRFLDIILKGIRYLFIQKIYIQDTRRKKEG